MKYFSHISQYKHNVPHSLKILELSITKFLINIQAYEQENYWLVNVIVLIFAGMLKAFFISLDTTYNPFFPLGIHA